jgi:Fe-S oxidoreductase
MGRQFINYYEPEIGFQRGSVRSPRISSAYLRDRKCCGRPAFSQGLLKRTAKLGEHNPLSFRKQKWRSIFYF